MDRESVPPRETILEAAVQALREANGPIDIPIDGESMQPLFRPGDRGRVDPNRPPRPGSIAVFRSGERLIVHRVLRIHEGGFDEMGDGGGLAQPVDSDDLLGVLTLVTTPDGRKMDLTGTVASAHGRLVAHVLRAAFWTRGKRLGLRRLVGLLDRALRSRAR